MRTDVGNFILTGVSVQRSCEVRGLVCIFITLFGHFLENTCESSRQAVSNLLEAEEAKALLLGNVRHMI
jgi:hypothetical protein